MQRERRGRAARLGLGGASLACVASLLVGCTGRPVGTSSWQGTSDRAIGEAISGLGTARIVVSNGAAGRIPHSYAVVTATDAIDSAQKEVSGYLVVQPPDSLHDAQATVVAALQQAVALLGDVRVAIASPGLDAEAAHSLVDRIDQLRERLDQLDSAVTASPGPLVRR